MLKGNIKVSQALPVSLSAIEQFKIGVSCARTGLKQLLEGFQILPVWAQRGGGKAVNLVGHFRGKEWGEGQLAVGFWDQFKVGTGVRDPLAQIFGRLKGRRLEGESCLVV